MGWVEKTFKGKSRVWVMVGEDGELITDDRGRVSMRYQNNEDAKVYSAYTGNLSDGEDAPKAKPAPTVNPKRVTNFDDNVWQSPVGDRFENSEVPDELADEVPPDPKVWEFYTDGACSGNPGKCGWGLVLRRGDDYYEANQFIGIGTNNIAELMAIKEALDHVQDPDAVIHIHSDSKYSIDILTKGWKAKKNKALIESIKTRLGEFSTTPTFFKVKGHSGHPLNERADLMATSAIED